MRSAAGLLFAARVMQGTETGALIALLAQLTRLAETVARLRDTQQRAVQAAAARSAADGLLRELNRRAGSLPTTGGPPSYDLRTLARVHSPVTLGRPAGPVRSLTRPTWTPNGPAPADSWLGS